MFGCCIAGPGAVLGLCGLRWRDNRETMERRRRDDGEVGGVQYHVQERY